MSLKCSQREPRGNPRNSKSPIELSCESELMSGRKMSISLESEFDPENQFSVILVKVSISLESELMSEKSQIPKWMILGCDASAGYRRIRSWRASRAKELRYFDVLEHGS